MRIGVFPADLEGCGHYRLIWPAAVLKDLGMNIDIIPPENRDNMFTATIEDDVVTAVQVPNYDVMIFQRITHQYLAQAVPLIRAKGITVIIDIDDDLQSIHPSNPAFTVLHPKKSPNGFTAQHSWEWCRVACDAATLVTVSSPALARRYAPHGRFALLRNYVPDEMLQIEHQDSRDIGWGGSIHSHGNDVPVLGASISRLIQDGFTFKVVGPGIGLKQALGLQDVPPHTGTVTMAEWPSNLASLGIGVAPLADTVFNQAKSWLKPLEMAALGVPSIISPRAEYREISKLGIGVLAKKPSDWYTKLKRLITDDVQRQELSAQVREVAAGLTVRGNAWRWQEAWTLAFNLQQRERPRPVTSVFGLDRPGYTAGQAHSVTK